MLSGQNQEFPDPLRLKVFSQGDRREQKAAADADALEERKPVFIQPRHQRNHAGFISRFGPAPKPPLLDGRWDIRPRADEQGTRDSHHPLAGSTPGARGKLTSRRGDVGANDGEVSGLKFKDVRTTVPAGARQCSGRVIQSKSSNKHGRTLTLVIYCVKQKLTIVI